MVHRKAGAHDSNEPEQDPAWADMSHVTLGKLAPLIVPQITCCDIGNINCTLIEPWRIFR